MSFKCGDRVEIISSRAIKAGTKGTILECKEQNILVWLDPFMPFICTSFRPEQLRLLPPTQKIVITTDGKTTLARMYEGKTVIKSAEAKCSPADEFDFNLGAKIAFGRLMKGEK